VSKIRVEYISDGPGWVFRVPALGITGGGQTREAAQQQARDAIALALEITPDGRPADDAEYLDVRLG
jgi:predicted RNase H-like HicB family nuclease